MTAVDGTSTTIRLQRLLECSAHPADCSPHQFVDALELGNELIRPSDLAPILVQLSDEAWEQLSTLRDRVRDPNRTVRANTATAQLFAMDPETFFAVIHLRRAYREAERDRDRPRMAMAVDAIRVAVTPPDQHRLIAGAAAEASDSENPALLEVEHAIEGDRTERFLRNFRRVRAEVAAAHPELKTQRGLSAASGVSVATISAIENGHTQPQLATIVKLAAGLGVPVERLIR